MKKTPYGKKYLIQSIVLAEGAILVMLIGFHAQGFGILDSHQKRKGSRWTVGKDSRISFWYGNWTKQGPI